MFLQQRYIIIVQKKICRQNFLCILMSPSSCALKGAPCRGGGWLYILKGDSTGQPSSNQTIMSQLIWWWCFYLQFSQIILHRKVISVGAFVASHFALNPTILGHQECPLDLAPGTPLARSLCCRWLSSLVGCTLCGLLNQKRTVGIYVMVQHGPTSIMVFRFGGVAFRSTVT